MEIYIFYKANKFQNNLINVPEVVSDIKEILLSNHEHIIYLHDVRETKLTTINECLNLLPNVRNTRLRNWNIIVVNPNQ